MLRAGAGARQTESDFVPDFAGRICRDRTFGKTLQDFALQTDAQRFLPAMTD